VADQVHFMLTIRGPEIRTDDKHAMIDITVFVRLGFDMRLVQLTCNPPPCRSLHL